MNSKDDAINGYDNNVVNDDDNIAMTMTYLYVTTT